MNSRRVLWQVLAAQSRVETQRGNLAEANALRAQAREVIEYIASQTPPQLRNSFLKVAQVRAALDPE